MKICNNNKKGKKTRKYLHSQTDNKFSGPQRLSEAQQTPTSKSCIHLRGINMSVLRLSVTYSMYRAALDY